jgi:hypothetical protein
MSNVIRSHAFGRLPRKFYSRVPHRSAVFFADVDHPAPPAAVGYAMILDFGSEFGDETYAITGAAWIESLRMPPAVLTLVELEEQKQSLKTG